MPTPYKALFTLLTFALLAPRQASAMHWTELLSPHAYIMTQPQPTLPPLLSKLLEINRLRLNLQRSIQEYDESTSSSNPDEWSATRSMQEARSLMAQLLANRKQLAKQPAKSLKYELQVRRATGLYGGKPIGDTDTQYRLVVQVLEELYSQVHTALSVDDEEKGKWRQLLEEELSQALHHKRYGEALLLVQAERERLLASKTEAERLLEWCEEMAPRFGKAPERYQIELYVIEYGEARALAQLADKVSPDTPHAAAEAALTIAYYQLLTRLKALEARAQKQRGASVYARLIRQAQPHLLGQKVTLHTQEYSAAKGEVSLRLFALTHEPISLRSYYTKRLYDKQGTEVATFAPQESVVVRQAYTHKLKATGFYSYRAYLPNALESNTHDVAHRLLALNSTDSRNGVEIVATSTLDGSPLSGVEVRLYDTEGNGERFLRKGRTDSQGRLAFQRGDRWMKVSVTDPRLAEKAWFCYLAPVDLPAPEVPTSFELHAYTDRPIYRYGQVVKVGLLATSVDAEKGSLIPAVSQPILLMGYKDGIEEQLASITITTNEKGVAEAAFQLPTDESYDDFYLTTKGEYSLYHDLRVSAYKLNHLTVHIDDIPTGFVVGREAVVKGRVTDLNGLPVPARLTLHYDTSDPRKRKEAEVHGEFELALPAFTSKEEGSYRGIKLSATDPLGHIDEALWYERVDTTSFPISADELLSSHAVEKSVFTLTTKTQPYHSRKRQLPSSTRITTYLLDGKGQRIPLGEIGIREEHTWDLSRLPSGAYTLVAEATDSYGQHQMSRSQRLLLYADSDPQPPIETALWVRPELRYNEEPHSDYRWRVGSSYPSTITAIVEWDEEEGKIDQFKVEGGLTYYAIPRALLQGKAAQVRFVTHHNGQEATTTMRIKALSDEHTQLAVTGFPTNDKHYPQGQVKRSLTIRDSKGAPLRKAPVLVTVYDRAVNEAAGISTFWSAIPTTSRLRPMDQIAIRGKGSMPSLMRAESAVMMTKSAAPAVAMQDNASSSGEEVVRSNFAETAYYTALLTTDNQGRVTYSYQLPGTQTQYVEHLFALSTDLTLQHIERHAFEVYAPLSAEVSLPRYLTVADRLEGEMLLRNAEEQEISTTYTIQVNGQEILRGEETLAPKGTAVIPFFLQPRHLSVGTAHVTARVQSAHYSDVVERELPIVTAESTYNVAVPFSLYQQRRFTLTLPKVERASTPLFMEVYLDPLHVLLTRLAQEYALDKETLLTDLSIFTLLHRYVVYGQMSHYVAQHPEVAQRLRQSASQLREAEDSPSSSKKSAHVARFLAERQAHPHVLADYYEFVTDSEAVGNYRRQLGERLLSYLQANGGWGWDPTYTSPWLSLYVVEALGDLPAPALSEELRRAVDRTIAYLDDHMASERQWKVSAIRYALARSLFHPDWTRLPSPLAAQLKKEYNEYAQHYRDTQYGIGTLLAFGQLTAQYGDRQIDREVQRFIHDLSAHTFSDREQVAFELYKQEQRSSLEPAVVEFLLTHKQGTVWDNAYFGKAVRTLLSLVAPTTLRPGASLLIGDHRHTLTSLELATGHLCVPLSSSSSSLEVQLSDEIRTDFSFGGLLYQVTEPTREVTATGDHLRVSKALFARRIGPNGAQLIPVSATAPARKGEQLVVRYTVETDRDLSLVYLRDQRPAAAEPGYRLRGWGWADRVWWSYLRQERTDLLFIDYLPRGRHFFDIEATANMAGSFLVGPAEVSSYYAPEFSGNSAGDEVAVSLR